jgi:hypothetical protein
LARVSWIFDGNDETVSKKSLFCDWQADRRPQSENSKATVTLAAGVGRRVIRVARRVKPVLQDTVVSDRSLDRTLTASAIESKGQSYAGQELLTQEGRG